MNLELQGVSNGTINIKDCIYIHNVTNNTNFNVQNQIYTGTTIDDNMTRQEGLLTEILSGLQQLLADRRSPAPAPAPADTVTPSLSAPIFPPPVTPQAPAPTASLINQQQRQEEDLSVTTIDNEIERYESNTIFPQDRIGNKL